MAANLIAISLSAHLAPKSPKALTISSFTPESGGVGTPVTILGTEFKGVQSVTFNGVEATFSVVSHTEITTNVPSGATTGTLSVATPHGTASSAASFTVTYPPAISSFSPASGTEGTEVTLTGSSFTGATHVNFNGTTAAFSVVSDNKVSTRVPSSATTGTISVATPLGSTSTANSFTVVTESVPQISSFTPTSGGVGTAVTLSGSGFSGATSVAFNEISATFTVSSDTQISTSVPSGATTGPIRVSTPQGSAFSSGAFTVLEPSGPPQIDSFTPASGQMGTLVWLNGLNFTGTTAVDFNGVNATQFNVSSDTQLNAVVPTGASTGKISVTTPQGSDFTSVDFVVQPPEAASCLQNGSTITISGGQTSAYDNKSLAPGEKIDATTAVWFGLGDNPVDFGGTEDICWSGGNIQGDYPPDLDWDTFHSTAAVKTVSAPNVTVENISASTYGDGIKLYRGTEDFTIRGVYLHDMHDDCIEGDWLPGGVIEDSLLDGCYQAFAARPRNKDQTSDGSNKTWVIKDSLVYVRPQIGVYKGVSPGNGGFFKWDNNTIPSRSPKVLIQNTIMRIDQVSSFNVSGMWVQEGKLSGCSNVTIVWLGEGPYPVPLPECVTLTNDPTVWDNAVAEWKTLHSR